MGAQRVLFARRYRAALLDYLLGGGESARARAYELGRGAVEDGFGLLQIVRAHQQAVIRILESTNDVNESLRRLRASEEFLMETLSPFEMTYRGYVALLEGDHEKPREERFSTWNGTERRRGKDRRVTPVLFQSATP